MFSKIRSKCQEGAKDCKVGGMSMPRKILCSIFEAVMDDYRIDESQWMKHIKPSLTGRLLTEWEAMPRQDRNYDKSQQLIITRVGDIEAERRNKWWSIHPEDQESLSTWYR